MDKLVDYPKFTENERELYEKNKKHIKFNSPEEEYDYSKKINKKCSKCKQNKKLIDFTFNTSGRDHFNKDGYRHRRPDCKECLKKVRQSKKSAKKSAKANNISYKAPNGETCHICKKENKLVFDHCHETHKYRGYLCDPCNRGLGIFQDNIEGLIAAVNYLLITTPTKIRQNKNGKLTIIK